MRTRLHRRYSETGYTVLSVMIGIAVVTIALVGHAMLAGIGALASRKARNDLGCRTVALARLQQGAGSVDGGSTAPEQPVDGWSDVVYLDPATGSIVVVDGRMPGSVTLISRQWRRGRDIEGHRVIEVSATTVDAAGRPLIGRTAASVTYSERAR